MEVIKGDRTTIIELVTTTVPYSKEHHAFIFKEDMVPQKLELGDRERPMTSSACGRYPGGLRLFALYFTVLLAVFLVNMEISIVSTSLVNITNELQGFEKSSWIVTAYLLSFIGFFIIYARISDIFGRKSCILVALATFVIFSGACGAAKSMNQLIIFRALQGLGASGANSICQILTFELIHPSKYASYAQYISASYALSFILGPTLGGVINQSDQWRWAFLLNVPAGVLCCVGIVLLLPNGFPNHADPDSKQESTTHRTTKTFTLGSIRRLDLVGAFLLLTATLLVLVGFEEAGVRYAYRSAFVISLLTISGIVGIAFFVWEWFLSGQKTTRDPIFPWRLVHRDYLSIFFSAIFLGPSFNVTVFVLPQRYMIVNGATALHAALRLIPYTILIPVGGTLSIVAAKKRVAPIYISLIGTTFQIVGLALLTTLPNTTSISHAQYGYQILAGFGIGMNLSMNLLMPPFVVDEKDKSIAISAALQFRYLGAALSLAVTTSVLTTNVRSHLASFLSPLQIAELLRKTANIVTYSPEVQDSIRQVFGDGYNLQMKILVGIVACQIPSILLGWRKKQILACKEEGYTETE